MLIAEFARVIVFYYRKRKSKFLDAKAQFKISLHFYPRQFKPYISLELKFYIIISLNCNLVKEANLINKTKGVRKKSNYNIFTSFYS